MLAPIEGPLSGVGLDPGHEIEHLAIDAFAGCDQFAKVTPVHEDVVDGAILGCSCGGSKRLDQEFDELSACHLARGHLEFRMLFAPAPNDASNPDVVWRIRKNGRCDSPSHYLRD